MTNVLNTLVPISRFNKGEASKIFEELKETGYKVVVKNNSPACVLLTPEVYEELMEAKEDEELLAIALERLENEDENTKYYSMEEVMEMAGITQEELEGIEVDID